MIRSGDDLLPAEIGQVFRMRKNRYGRTKYNVTVLSIFPPEHYADPFHTYIVLGPGGVEHLPIKLGRGKAPRSALDWLAHPVFLEPIFI